MLDCIEDDQIGATYEELEWAMDYLESDHKNMDLTNRKLEILDIYKKFHEKNKHKMINIPVLKINNKI